MSLCVHSLFRRICKIRRQSFSTAVNVKDIQQEPLQSFRTVESDPTRHNEDHLNRFYTIPENVCKTLYQDNITLEFRRQIDTFAECSLLIRKPAVEIISCLEQTDYTKAVNKYLLYGKFGTGKTMTMMHILHYAYMKQLILLHVPWCNSWFRFPKEVSPSPLIPGQLDLPIDAGLWLKYFRMQNQSILSTLDLKVSKDYEWSQRESTKTGTSLLSLVEFGINRIKFACGVVNALVDELKAASTAGKCRTLIAIDGFNGFLSDHTTIRDEHKKYVSAKKFTLTTAFVNSTDCNWCNGAVILTVDTRASKDKRDSELPIYLLGKKEFERLDPLVPIAIENYTPSEFETVLEYYKNRKWIRNISEEGQRELELLSHRNPFSIMHICKSL